MTVEEIKQGIAAYYSDTSRPEAETLKGLQEVIVYIQDVLDRDGFDLEVSPRRAKGAGHGRT